MIRTLDFNALPAGTVVDNEYEALGVTVSATGGSCKAMIFDSSNPTGGDHDLATDNLGGVLIISEDGDRHDPDDNASGGTLSFDFDDAVQMKEITFLDIEETACMNFYDTDGNLIESQFVGATDNNGQVTVQLSVPGTARFEVVLQGSGAIDNLTFEDGVNEDPDARNDHAITDEDTPVVIDALANDSDPNGDPLTIVGASSPNGTVDINDDGTVTFTPAPDFNGDTTISYTVDDGNGGTDTAFVDVSVCPVNDAPVANDDSETTPFETSVVIDVLGNDTDVDGDPLVVVTAASPDGTVDINDDGTLTFTPGGGFEGEASISYTIADPDGLEDDATVAVTVGVNPCPQPHPDGLVDGSDAGELIDVAYAGDPNGDFVDNEDRILPGITLDDDIIRAMGGDDTVLAGDGFDVVFGGKGDDQINGEGENDTLFGGTGSDTILGGLGHDQIDSGNHDLAPDLGYPNAPIDPDTGFPTDPLGFAPDSDPENDRDSVDGGEGNDTIRTGDDRDTITGGTGHDVINAGIDDDIVSGDGGNDRIVGGEGNDNILGGDGADTIYAGNDPDLGLDLLDIPDEALESNSLTPDRRPDNGRDTVDGGAGNDVIYGADDDDVLLGGAGDDFIDGQIDDDTLVGGLGDDTLHGGAGEDLIDAGREAAQDIVYAGDDSDTIAAGVGDTVFGGEGGKVDFDNLIVGGGLSVVDYAVPGDPTSEAGVVTELDEDLNVIGTTEFSEIERVFALDIDGSEPGGSSPGPGTDSLNNVVEGTASDDLIDLGYTGDPDGDRIDNDDALPPLEGDEDIVLAFGGDDTVVAGAANDLVYGGTGDDELYGEAGSDGLSGNAGDDSLDGGAGRDILVGGDGDDTLSGSNTTAGDGGDLLYGNEGDDSFVDIGVGEVVVGGEDSDGLDEDVLDLTGAAEAANAGGSLTVAFDPDDAESGTVTFLDASGDATGTASFSEIERVVPCFTPGTRIATPKGERKVEELVAGDRVITRDNGIQEIRWVGQRDMTGAEFERATHLRPVLIREGALGNDLPERDMMVSPNHRILVANDKSALYFEEREVLVAAKHLTDLDGVDVVDVSGTTYVHLMFDQHEVILSDGTWTESFQPGDMSLAGIGDAQRDEILELFPELATREGVDGYASARRALKKYEARLLTK